MTRRERDLVRKAELAALGVPDAAELLSAVTAELRAMVVHGRVREADRTLAAMLPSTVRLLSLCALGDLDRQRGRNLPDGVADLLARKEAAYADALAREDARLESAEQDAEKIRTRNEQRARDRQFLSRLHAIRREKAEQ